MSLGEFYELVKKDVKMQVGGIDEIVKKLKSDYFLLSRSSVYYAIGGFIAVILTGGYLTVSKVSNALAASAIKVDEVIMEYRSRFMILENGLSEKNAIALKLIGDLEKKEDSLGLLNMVEVSTPIITHSFSSGLGKEDRKNSGLIEGRTLTFHKMEGDSAVRISYTDNLRVAGEDKGCRWGLLVDSATCPSGDLVYDYYVANMQNPHRSYNVVGYCEGLGRGLHTISVQVAPVPHNDNSYDNSDCSTGWKDSRWTLEAVEFPKELNRTAGQYEPASNTM